MKTIDQSVINEINNLHANICAAISDPNRILILYSLNNGSKNVTEISKVINLNQSSTSRHLKILKEKYLIKAKRVGNSTVYKINDDRIISALNLLRAVLIDSLQEQAGLAHKMSDFY